MSQGTEPTVEYVVLCASGEDGWEATVPDLPGCEAPDTYAVSAGLRPLDALQLASALQVHATDPVDALITTDTVMTGVALASGLTIKP